MVFCVGGVCVCASSLQTAASSSTWGCFSFCLTGGFPFSVWQRIRSLLRQRVFASDCSFCLLLLCFFFFFVLLFLCVTRGPRRRRKKKKKTKKEERTDASLNCCMKKEAFTCTLNLTRRVKNSSFLLHTQPSIFLSCFLLSRLFVCFFFVLQGTRASSQGWKKKQQQQQKLKKKEEKKTVLYERATHVGVCCSHTHLQSFLCFVCVGVCVVRGVCGTGCCSGILVS